VPRSDLLLLICHPLVDSLLVPATCGAIADCLCILAALSLPCSRLAVTSSPLLPAIVIIASAVAAPQGRGRQRQLPSASWGIIPIGATATTDAVLPAAASAASVASVRMPPLRRTLWWHRRSHRRSLWTQRTDNEDMIRYRVSGGIGGGGGRLNLNVFGSVECWWDPRGI
jgi:hypothetical protein